jgi:hypothetical protein
MHHILLNQQPNTGFNPRPVHMGFVVEKVAVRQMFFRILPFTPAITIPLKLRMIASTTDAT